ncbi:MAG TPA: hypothetical protein VF898_05315, partial [Chloroflexota bacterium]
MGLVRSLLQRGSRRIVAGIFILSLTVSLLAPQFKASAAVSLGVTPLTWNVVGLDSNNVSVGPSNFPVGARVCNTGSTAATNVVAAFNWDSSNPYIDLRPGSLQSITLPTLGAGSVSSPTCYDFYFEVAVQRTPSAYDATRRYHISVTATGGISLSTPTPREIYVEHLISQSRNSVSDVLLNGTSVAAGGTMTLMVGSTYDITLVGSTATNGYEQLESFINFPNTIFRVNSVSSTHTADAGTDPNAATKPYADGCGWINDPTSPNYRSCTGTGKYGGNITVDYNVTIIGGGGTSQVLNTLIYDFSGSSYHYNGDFSSSARIASIVNATITKAFTPHAIAPGGTSTLTFTITNPGSSPLAGVNFADPLPSGLSVASTPNAGYLGCGSGAFSPALAGGETSLTFSGATIAAFGTCTVTVDVTAQTTGSYTNTTQDLFINTSTDTFSTATDVLVVGAKPDPPACGANAVTLATWTMPNTTNPPVASLSTGVAFANASNNPVNGNFTVPLTGNPADSWMGTNWPASGAQTPTSTPYFQLTVDTSQYGATQLKFDYDLEATNNWGSNNNNIYVHSEPDYGSWSSTQIAATKGKWQTVTYTTPANGTGAARTTFRINASGASGSTATFALDNISILGCPRLNPPTLSKSFSPTSILQNNTSTLTFSLLNPNTLAGQILHGVSFTDTLPAGLSVATASVSNACGAGNGTLVTDAATRTISLSGVTLNPSATCTFGVTVTGTAAGLYHNLSQSITSTETGPNTTSSGYGDASLTVVDPPTISKSFGTASIFTNGTTSLTFSILNPNSIALNGVQFSDSLPSGLVVATPNGISGTCGGGTITAAGGS